MLIKVTSLGGTSEGLDHPDVRWRARDLVFGAVDPTGQGEVGSVSGARIDVTAVHAHRRGPQEPRLAGLRVSGDLANSHVRLRASANDESSQMRQVALAVRALVDVQKLHSHGTDCPSAAAAAGFVLLRLSPAARAGALP